MDILQAYEKNQPKAHIPSSAQEQLLAQRYASDTGFFVRLVMRLSGGRIQDVRRASLVLLIASGVIVVIALAIFASGGGNKIPPSPPVPNPKGELQQ